MRFHLSNCFNFPKLLCRERATTETGKEISQIRKEKKEKNDERKKGKRGIMTKWLKKGNRE